MIFHTPDPTTRTLASCWKRAQRYATPGDFTGHPLAVLWENIKYFNRFTESDRDMNLKNDYTDAAYSVVLMDYFASRVEQFLKTNMLDSDTRLHALLYEWRDALGFNPTRLAV